MVVVATRTGTPVLHGFKGTRIKPFSHLISSLIFASFLYYTKNMKLSVIAPYDIYELAAEDEQGITKLVYRKGQRMTVAEAQKYKLLPIQVPTPLPPLEHK